MLEEIEITNFRCLRSVKVPLRPLTVLIGPNDSGKSAFLAAIRYLSTLNTLQDFADPWRQDPKSLVAITARWQGNQCGISNRGGHNQSLIEKLTPLSSFHLPSQGVDMQSHGSNDANGPPMIGNAGENVPSFFDYLLRRDRSRFFAAVEVIKSLVPGVEDVEIATPTPEIRRLDLVIDHGLRIHASQASTGVRLLIVFVALAYHPTPSRTILLEEPETGIHPKRLAEIMHLLREITQGKHGDHPAQVILTTHSPYLLDLVNLETDQVLVFRRNDDDGSRTAEPVDAERLKLFMDEFMLGEVWYNQGEGGLIAKRS